MIAHDNIRTQILETLHKSVDTGLIRLSAGNISVRLDDGTVAITPASLPYDQMVPKDILIVDPDGRVLDGSHKPSSEAPMHLYILRHLPAFDVVFHTHSVSAMTFAALGQEIPIVNTELLVCGGPIPVTPWACPGTETAGLEVVKLLRERPRLRAVLLRSHGLVSVGATLKEAYSRAMDTETGAEVYHKALQVGTPIVISEEELAEVYENYGM